MARWGGDRSVSRSGRGHRVGVGENWRTDPAVKARSGVGLQLGPHDGRSPRSRERCHRHIKGAAYADSQLPVGNVSPSRYRQLGGRREPWARWVTLRTVEPRLAATSRSSHRHDTALRLLLYAGRPQWALVPTVTPRRNPKRPFNDISVSNVHAVARLSTGHSTVISGRDSFIESRSYRNVHTSSPTIQT